MDDFTGFQRDDGLGRNCNSLAINKTFAGKTPVLRVITFPEIRIDISFHAHIKGFAPALAATDNKNLYGFITVLEPNFLAKILETPTHVANYCTFFRGSKLTANSGNAASEQWLGINTF
jgi:hypothetical protein